MEDLYDDSQLHDISFEEFQEMIDTASEVEIPLDAFQDFVDEMNDNDVASYWDVTKYLQYAEECISSEMYKEAFSAAFKYRKSVPQQQLSRLYEIYDACSEHGILDANIVLADHYFERWEAPDNYRGKAFKYLQRLYKAGYLPYYWKVGYCYLYGMGVSPSKMQARSIFMDGMLYGGDDICAGYLQDFVPEVKDALEDATRLFFDKSSDFNYQRAYELFLNALIYAGRFDMGYPLMRIADIQMEKNVDKSATPRKSFLMYKSALRLGVWDAPEEDKEFDEAEIYYKLGVMYFDGFGTKKDYFKAACYMSYGWLPIFDTDEKSAAMRERYVREAWEKAEQLSNDEEEWSYYQQCYENEEVFDLFDEEEDPEDAFLFI